MDLGISEKLRPIRDQVSKMVSDQIAPLDSEYFDEVEKEIDGSLPIGSSRLLKD